MRCRSQIEILSQEYQSDICHTARGLCASPVWMLPTAVLKDRTLTEEIDNRQSSKGTLQNKK